MKHDFVWNNSYAMLNIGYECNYRCYNLFKENIKLLY